MTRPSQFDQKLQTLADSERRLNSVQERIQRGDRAVVAGLSGAFLGTLLELIETASPCTILTRTGSAIRGTVTTAGTEAVQIRTDKAGSDVLVRIAAIEGIIEQGSSHNRGVSEFFNGPSFGELIESFCETNDRIAVTVSSGNHVMGTPQVVGEDQLVIELDGRGDVMTVPLHAIDQVVQSR